LIIAQFQYDAKPVTVVAPERTASLFSDDHARLKIMLATKIGKRAAQ
jgi:hypothetical protein